MCAEFTPGQPLELEKLIHAALVIKEVFQFDGNLRVYPGQRAPILRLQGDSTSELQLEMAEFSLIPEWWDPAKSEKKRKNGRPVFATHNARLETIHQKPAFRKSFEARHCIVPIRSFFESSLFGEKFAGHRVEIAGASILFAAGCFNEWMDPSTGEVTTTFTIITRDPYKEIFEAGHDRSPIFLNAEKSLEWLQLRGQKGLDLQDYLEKNYLKNIPWKIQIDRELKAGWEKNAPEAQELAALQKRIS